MTLAATPHPDNRDRPKRADAQRKQASLLKAASAVFAESGVDAPVREIAERAGVGIGTVYRHFPQRSDLIVALFQSNVDACAEASYALAREHPPLTALSLWLERYLDLIATKHGLSKALYSGDAAYQGLPEYFSKRLRPVLAKLLDAAAKAKAVRPGIDPDDLLVAIANLCSGGCGRGPQHAVRMVKLLVDGLRFGASAKAQ